MAVAADLWTSLLKLGRPVDANESWWKTAEICEFTHVWVAAVFRLLRVGFSEDRSTPMMVCGKWSSSLEAV